jgi:hypothetical protein
VRLANFTIERLFDVGVRVRDIYRQYGLAPERVTAKVDDDYVRDLARAVTGRLGGKVGVAPRVFLKKLVADVLDRVDQFPDFEPRSHYALTMSEAELTPTERSAAGGLSVDDIAIEP